MRSADASRGACVLVLAVASGLAFAQCGGLRSTRAGPEDAAVQGPQVDAGNGASSSGAAIAPPSFDPCADPGCPSFTPCKTNSDCAGACRLTDGHCVECVVDVDCHDPDRAVCGPDDVCAACRSSADCVANGAGPICTDGGTAYGGYGNCVCVVDADCTGRAGGPHCVIDRGQGECECQSAADCTQSRYGLACKPAAAGFAGGFCGCTTDSDCPSPMTCAGGRCAPSVSEDGGLDAEAGPDAATGSVRCFFAYSSPQGGSSGGGVGAGCNGEYRSDLGDYSVTWTQSDGGTVVCNSSDPNAPANCPAGTPCIYTSALPPPEGVPGGSVMGTCQ